jgi:hypothetical protein
MDLNRTEVSGKKLALFFLEDIMLKTIGHMLLGFITGGLWFLYLLIRYITKK